MAALKTLFEEVLRVHEQDPDLTVARVIHDDYKIAIGENFLSDTSVLAVDGSLGSGKPYSCSVFVKRAVLNNERREFFRVDDAFTNEAIAYCIVFPLIQGISEIIPECLLATKGLTMMKNLQVEGYKMADKLKGVDLAHAEVVIEAMAKFHAGGYKLTITKDEIETKNLMAGTYNYLFDKDNFMSLLEAAVAPGVDNLKLAADKSVNLAIEKLEDIISKKNFRKILLNMHESKNLSVYLHGDPWINNMLFHYNNGVVDGVKFIDFQMFRRGSLAIDVFSFLYTSVSPKVLNDNYNHLLSLYVSTFRNTVKSLNVPDNRVPSEEDLRKEINSRELYGLLLAQYYVNGIVSDWSDSTIEFLDEAMSSKEAWTKNIFKVNNKISARLVALAKTCLDRGVFDYKDVEELPND